MKKLLVTAIGAAAAFGAFADFNVGARFEGIGDGETSISALNTEAASDPRVSSGTYWVGDEQTNKYTVTAMDGSFASRPAFFNSAPNKALEVKTTFGQPLKFNFMGDAGETKKTVGDEGLYFDSLVKFTVCDGAPDDKDAYNGAKIMMWLQSDDDTVTNIVVKAGYLTYSAGTVSSVATNYTCYTVDGDFADQWHRVTIKVIADITNGEGVPGFVVFIDGDVVNVPLQADYNVFGDGFPARNENAGQWEVTYKALFPSMVQNGNVKQFSAIEFDGTGSINDVTVTDTAPDFAKDLAAPEVTDVYINGDLTNVTTIADAVALANNASTASISLNKGFTLEEPIVFTGSATITLDFAGFVLTNNSEFAAITNSAASLTITDSVGNGGIYCTKRLVDEYEDWGMALYNTATLTIQGGNFWGYIVTDTATVSVTGGGFASIDDVYAYIAPGKKYSQSGDLYIISDKESYTVTYDTAGGLPVIDSQSVMEGEKAPVPETVLTKTGYTFAGWSPDIAATTITGPTTFTAQWTINTYLVTFMNGEDTFATTNVEYNTVAEAPVPAPTKAGYTFDYWYTSDPAVEYSFATPVTDVLTLNAKFTADTYTVTFYTNTVEYATATYTYGDASTYSAPTDPSVDGYTFGGWYTDNGTFNTEFEFSANVAGNTQVAYAKLTQSGGGSEWDPDPSVIDESKTAAQEYPALADTPLATANAKKLTVWAKANGVDFGDVKSATTDIVDSYLLNCSEAQLESAKAAFAIPSITFDEDGKPVIAEPTGNYNGNIQKKGSDNLSTWTVIDGSTHKAEDFQFFKLELVP